MRMTSAAAGRPRPGHHGRAVTVALGAVILIVTALAMWPIHRVVVAVVSETNAEYGKAAGAYGEPVPLSVEGGSPGFVVAAVVVLAAVEIAGIAVLAAVLRRRGVLGRTRVVAVLVAAGVLALTYVIGHLITGPFWPPSSG